MAYGIQLRNYKRQIFFDSTRTTWNYLGTFIAAANADYTWTIPSIGLTLKEIHISRTLLDRPIIDQQAKAPYAHAYTMSTNSITATHDATHGTVRTQFVILGR